MCIHLLKNMKTFDTNANYVCLYLIFVFALTLFSNVNKSFKLLFNIYIQCYNFLFQFIRIMSCNCNCSVFFFFLYINLYNYVFFIQLLIVSYRNFCQNMTFILYFQFLVPVIKFATPK